ncbi:MAG: primosomal protein N' [Desulfobacterales bacterium]|nr:primosomal protein N' [Desulfobacterales bacterium]
MTYLEVAVAAPLDHTLTYGPPERGSGLLRPGMRLLVPLAGRQVTGYLLGEVKETPPGHWKIKPITEVLDEEPLFSARQVTFYRWIASYYHYPLGEVIRTGLPGGLVTASSRRVLLTESGQRNLPGHASYPWVEELVRKGQLTPAVTRKIWRTKGRRLVKQWEQEGWVEIREEIRRSTTRIRTESCITLIPGSELPALKPSEQKTLALLEELTAAAGQEEPILRRQLSSLYSGAGQALKGLAAKGVVRLHEKPVYRDPLGETLAVADPPEHLTPEQSAALEQLLPAVRQQRFAPFLLHGVTGSGKTEIYLRAAAATLNQSRGVLVLVPEIALAAYLEAQFIARFGERVALLHSGLSAGERFDQWLRIARGEATVVVGARSAIFAPLSDPGLIVVDEEHDNGYKQEDGLRYQARDLAVLRARQAGAVVLLGSATPSITSYHHARTGKYQLLTLAKRIEDRPLPAVQVVDLRRIKTVSGYPPLFSPDLVKALKENLGRGEQSLLFLNRRGYANLMLCRSCGRSVTCGQCQVAMTMHKGRNELLCHYCGHVRAVSAPCPSCNGSELIGVGFGTERLQAELGRILPAARVARLDRDTCSKRRDYLAVLRAMHNLEIDILVGTQMIAKGHHFPRVTLVGIVWADAGLGLPDFRAGERVYQLIGQVGGRAGRGEWPGRVIIQTHQPDHASIHLARSNDYPALYEQEISLRRGLGFPPFSRLINIRIKGRDEQAVAGAARALAGYGKGLIRSGIRGVQLLGPAPAPLSRLRGNYRWQLLVKGIEVESLHLFCQRLVREGPGLDRRVMVSLDVDPENML